MRCPRCKKLHPIEAYMRMQEIEEFETQTNPIYKCTGLDGSGCKWIFSPGDPSLPFVLAEVLEEMRVLRQELETMRNTEVIRL